VHKIVIACTTDESPSIEGLQADGTHLALDPGVALKGAWIFFGEMRAVSGIDKNVLM